MSLKAFHLFFIGCSVALAVGVGIWCLASFAATGQPMKAVLGVGCLLAGGGLVAYGVSVVKKFRHIGFMALALMVLPRLAEACPACWGDADSPQFRGMQAAVFFLLGVTGIVMGGFVSLFVYFWKRGRKVAMDNALIVSQMMEASRK